MTYASMVGAMEVLGDELGAIVNMAEEISNSKPRKKSIQGQIAAPAQAMTQRLRFFHDCCTGVLEGGWRAFLVASLETVAVAVHLDDVEVMGEPRISVHFWNGRLDVTIVEPRS